MKAEQHFTEGERRKRRGRGTTAITNGEGKNSGAIRYMGAEKFISRNHAYGAYPQDAGAGGFFFLVRIGADGRGIVFHIRERSCERRGDCQTRRRGDGSKGRKERKTMDRGRRRLGL